MLCTPRSRPCDCTGTPHFGSLVSRYGVTVLPSALTAYNGPRMSLTNRRFVAGSSTRVIMRAATPSMSGSEANSRSVTVMTPSVLAIGCGNGWFVCPGGAAQGAFRALALELTRSNR